MNQSTDRNMPLVSVIIPCFNHARFLQEAVESVLQQTYPNIEIIIVNDGSTDDTEQTAKSFEGIKYFYQPNKGLSAARNAGIKEASGEFLVFLDADDWLYKDAIFTNFQYLQRNPLAAFVSGAHDKVTSDKKFISEAVWQINSDHYLHLLQGNYIGMHATVMYRRHIFDEFLFDTNLKACEDYDLYLRIARKHPVVHHTHKLAPYRIHGNNMSSDISMMLDMVLQVHSRQERLLTTAEEKKAFQNGRRIWKEYYTELINNKKNLEESDKSLSNSQDEPQNSRSKMSRLKSFVKKITPSPLLRVMHRAGMYKNYNPLPGKVNAGDFDRLSPFSLEFGYDRGGPVDRYYIENFLHKYSPDIKGRVLEIGDNEYTTRFGDAKVDKSEILHVDENNAKANYIADLSNAPVLPDNNFDCIILTQTLHLIYDFKGAIQTCHRVLKPGGVLLMTSPGITLIDHGEWNDSWLWSFTRNSIQRILAENFPSSFSEVKSHGNLFVATAFLYGMGLPEVSKEKMDFHDPHYEVIITARAVKSSH